MHPRSAMRLQEKSCHADSPRLTRIRLVKSAKSSDEQQARALQAIEAAGLFGGDFVSWCAVTLGLDAKEVRQLLHLAAVEARRQVHELVAPLAGQIAAAKCWPIAARILLAETLLPKAERSKVH